MRLDDFEAFLQAAPGREVSHEEWEAEMNRKRAERGLPPMRKAKQK